MNTTVLGSGSWGTAIAILLAPSHNVTLYCKSKGAADSIAASRENFKYLKGAVLPESVNVITQIEKAMDADIVVVAVPSTAVRSVLQSASPHAKAGTVFVSVSKGLDEVSLKRVSEVMEELLPKDSEIAVLSGPSHAEEVAKNMPTVVVAASKSMETAKKVQDAFMTPAFRVYTSNDVAGVELGGTVKNVIALAAGISDGLGYGDNTKAALMTRGMSEIIRLGTAIGGNAETFAGLTGIGDLIVTCTSMHSRNRRAGILLGKGKTLKETLSEVSMVVEGINSAKSILKLAEKYNIDMPIVEEINKVLFEGKDPREATNGLMTRDKKQE